MHKLKIFWELGFRKQLMFIEAFILSGVYRFMVLYLPFKYVKKRLGVPKKESAKEESVEVYRLAKEIPVYRIYRPKGVMTVDAQIKWLEETFLVNEERLKA